MNKSTHVVLGEANRETRRRRLCFFGRGSFGKRATLDTTGATYREKLFIYKGGRAQQGHLEETHFKLVAKERLEKQSVQKRDNLLHLKEKQCLHQTLDRS